MLHEQPTTDRGVRNVRCYSGRRAITVLCKLCSVRQSTTCWLCWLAAFSEISQKIKLYLCFWISKWRQIKLSSQMFRDWRKALVLFGRILNFLHCFSFSLSLFSTFLYFRDTENYFYSMYFCFTTSYSLSQIYYVAFFALTKKTPNRAGHFPLSGQGEIFLSHQCCGRMWEFFICIT